MIVPSSSETAAVFSSRRTYDPVLLLALGRLHARKVEDVVNPSLVRSAFKVAFHFVIDTASQVLTTILNQISEKILGWL